MRVPHLPDGTWRDALYMAAQTHRHTASLIVAERVDKPFLFDVFARGACAVLWKPFDFTQAIDRIRTLDQAAHDRAAWLAGISSWGRLQACGGLQPTNSDRPIEVFDFKLTRRPNR